MTEGTGVVVAAFIAGLVGLVSLIITKEQSVSEFRQKWIDELRRDVADLVGRVGRLHGEAVSLNPEPRRLWERVREEWPRFHEVTTRIRLRLNPQEHRPTEGPATHAALACLRDLEAIFDSAEPRLDRIPQLVRSFVENSQVILKENWVRVRKGEFTYRCMLWFTIAVIAGTAVYLVHKYHLD